MSEVSESASMILFFYGSNSYASRRKLQEMVQTYLKKTGSNLGLERIDGASTDAKTLGAAIRAVPFLATSRLVIVEYLGANKTASAKITDITRDVPATTVVVFYEKEVDKRTAYFKHLETAAQVQHFDMLGPTGLAAWVGRQVKARNAEIEPAAMAELIDRVGDDQWRLEQEIIKLVNTTPIIARDDVSQMVEQGRDDNIFGLVEAMAAGKTKTAIAQYQLMLDSGANEMYVLSMVIWQLRNLLLAKTAGPMPPGELAKQAGISPFVAGKASARQGELSYDQLRRAFLAAVTCEYRIKTGAGKPQELIELLIYNASLNVTGR